MGASIDLGIAIAMLLGLLSSLCAISSVKLRHSAPLAWVAAGLAVAAIKCLVVTQGRDMVLGFPIETILEPLGYVLAGQTIYALMPEMGRRRYVLLTVAALSVVSLVQHLFEVPFYYQAATFELACTVAMLDSTLRVLHHGRSDLLHRALTVSVVGLFLITLGRLVLLLLMQPGAITVANFSQTSAELIYAMVGAAISPVIILLLLIRIIGDTIATYQHQSERDGLTGLFNRRAFDVTADSRAGIAGAVIFCDIDHFKQVNDRFGHQTGDDVICAFAALIAPLDGKVARIGGEEFALLLPGRSATEAKGLAESIRQRFTECAHASLPHTHRVSASFGVATYCRHETAREAVTRADAALYQAKSAGRNRVVVHGATTPQPVSRLTNRRRAA